MIRRVNGELGHRLGDGVLAALISTGAGGVLLVFTCLVLPSVRGGVGTIWRAVRAPAGAGARPALVLRWWHCLGGLVAGQLSGSLVLDLASRPLTVSVVAGTGLALLAVLVASRR